MTTTLRLYRVNSFALSSDLHRAAELAARNQINLDRWRLKRALRRTFLFTNQLSTGTGSRLACMRL